MFTPIQQALRNSILSTRVALTHGRRRREVAEMASRGEAPLQVLFYHRVADEFPNDWTISVADFERHVQYASENFDLVSLEEAQRRSRRRESFRPSVTFTFDDGYADNCRHAIPLLIRHRIPTVYFVSIDNIRYGRPFQHDVAAGQPLAVNTVEELRAISDGGIEIGLHTRNHFDFSQPFDEETIRTEIIEAHAELEDWLGKPVRYFAFPFGMPPQLQPRVIQAVHDCGMLGFCSAYGGYNLPGADAFHIRRIHGDREMQRLKNWLTFDSRKLRLEPTITYTLDDNEDTLPMLKVCDAV